MFGEHVDNALRIEVHPAVAERAPGRHGGYHRRLRRRTRTRPECLSEHSRRCCSICCCTRPATCARTACARYSCTTSPRWLRAYETPTGLHCLCAGRQENAGARSRRSRSRRVTIPAPCRRTCCASFAALCPRALRFATDRETLTDVSWSNLHIHAFPGIAWSRTPLDALRYVRSRALPRPQSLERSAIAVQVQPQLKQRTLVRTSHSKRIARWLVSQPAARADDGLNQRGAQKPRPRRGWLTAVVIRRAVSTAPRP